MEHTEIGFGATGLTITRTLRCAAEIAHDIAEREYMPDGQVDRYRRTINFACLNLKLREGKHVAFDCVGSSMVAF
jgi:hypothetical protein